MDSHQGLRVLRIIVSLATFVALLCGGVFLAFGVRFQPIDIKDFSASKSGSKAKPFFYKSVGGGPRQEDLPSAHVNQLGLRYTLEIDMTDKKENAEKLVDKLAEAGVQAYYTPLQNNGRVVYRIRRGIYPSETVALRAASELKQSKNVHAKVVQLR